MSLKVTTVLDESGLLSSRFEKAEEHQGHCHLAGPIDLQIRALVESKVGFFDGQRKELTAQTYLERLKKGSFKEMLSDSELKLKKEIEKASLRGVLKGAAIGASTGVVVGGGAGGVIGFFLGIPVAGGGAIVSTPIGVGLGALAGALVGGGMGLAIGIAFTKFKTIIQMVEKSDDFKTWIERIKAEHLFDHLILFVDASQYIQDEKILDCPVIDRRGRKYHKEAVEKNWRSAKPTESWIADHLPDFETASQVHHLFLDWIQTKLDLVEEMAMSDQEVAEFQKSLLACKEMISESYALSLRMLVDYSHQVVHHLQVRFDYAAHPSQIHPFNNEAYESLKEKLEIVRERAWLAQIEGTIRQSALQLEMGMIDDKDFWNGVYAALEPYDLDPEFCFRMKNFMRDTLERLEFVAIPFNGDEEDTTSEEESL
jgi:hypothetical protein